MVSLVGVHGVGNFFAGRAPAEASEALARIWRADLCAGALGPLGEQVAVRAAYYAHHVQRAGRQAGQSDVDGLPEEAQRMVREWLRLWEVESGASRALEGHGHQVNAVAFSPDGRQLVSSGSYDRTLRLWEAESGASRALEGHSDQVRAVAFSPDGRHVASASAELRMWEVASGASRVLGYGGEGV